ncbi:Frag1/DRAM/Sfk1 family-domain-containing protein [Ephemerocybe angulata]|uniref:Frag1/DRAM/Sfk1 family-domain-containing protein n=1 Tax=Ephemerocybe angulata TaxID=980116 RepID=A0A8H6HZ88_9AGAR|nr:Frag1/DRAM/Sfk1 family-domain-containing protein [Tulosesus angulatus]
MFHVPERYYHWSYVWIPIITGFVWYGTLWAMLITWLAQGRPRYVSQDGRIAYISDRYLRHSGRLLPHMRRREKVFSTLAVLGAFMGGCGLILLSIFDTKRYTSAHRAFLLVFMIGVALSAIFTIIEYHWIKKDFTFARELRIAYWAKGIIAGTLIILSIAFAVTLYEATDAGAVLEWLIAMLFTSYIWTYFYDLHQSKGVRKGELSEYKMRQPNIA